MIVLLFRWRAPVAVRAAAVAVALFVGFGLCAGSAAGAVAWGSAATNSATTSNGQTISISVTKPTATVAGDLLIAAVSIGGSTNGGCACTGYVNNPAGWTLLDTHTGASGAPHQSKTFYKIATGSEAASYSFSGGETTVFYSVAGRATIDRFTGVDNADPFAGTPSGTQTTGTTATNVALPNQTSEAAGSMRYSAVTTWKSATGVPTTTFSAGLTERGDAGATISYTGAGFFYTTVSVATATEAVDAGVTTARTGTLSAAQTAWAGRTYVINPDGPLSSGSVALSATLNAGTLSFIDGTPGDVTFPPTALTNTNQVITATQPITIADATGTGSGWSISVTSTTFTTGSRTLSNTATTILAAPPVACKAATTCTTATNSVTYPFALPAAASAPTATKLYNAAAETGLGAQTITPTWRLAIPATTYAGTYTSTWTFTLTAGP